MNTNLLKAKIVERGLTQEKLAAEINMSKSAFSKRINEKIPFSVIEVRAIKETLRLNDNEICSIFL